MLFFFYPLFCTTEVVLCPFLPDGSQFLLKFRTNVEKNSPKVNPVRQEFIRQQYAFRAPDSPSAEPSHFPSTVDFASVNAQQLQLLLSAAAFLKPHGIRHQHSPSDWSAATAASSHVPRVLPTEYLDPLDTPSLSQKKESSENSGADEDFSEQTSSVEAVTNSNLNHKPADLDPRSQTDELIAQRLRQLNELFLLRRGEANTDNDNDTNFMNEDDEVKAYRREEKRQVIFVIANYFVLFMSLIALSAEIQSRLPQWMKWVQENYDSVQNCATDRDTLFECVSNGDFSGLVASFLLWATQSASAKRIFLFVFDSPKRLWTVVYEALVTAVCWGLSYLFIRRGLNPNTRQNFLQQYWKDAVYGSLAGFNAAFMKAVLKNLVPQDVALEALESRQLKIFNWLGPLMANE